MLKHQDEYIKLIDEKFGIVGKPKVATYKRYGCTKHSGIVVELPSYDNNPRLLFLADNPMDCFHRLASELDSKHLPRCVWITRYTDNYLDVLRGFYV